MVNKVPHETLLSRLHRSKSIQKVLCPKALLEVKLYFWMYTTRAIISFKDLVISLLVYKVEWSDFHIWYLQEQCMFERQGKEHFAVANSSFGDVFDKNYFVVSILFVASKKIWISKIDGREISISFKILCIAMWVNCRSADVFLAFIII